MKRDALQPETLAYLCDETALSRFRDRLRRSGKRVVRINALWKAFLEVYPDPPFGLERRAWLSTVLIALAERGELKLPSASGKRWDRTSNPAVPRAISLVEELSGAQSPDVWRAFPWHPSLQWILDLRALTTEQFDFLKGVNRGLVNGWFATPECFKYRSLQLTGDEKRLEAMISGVLFLPGRLNLEALGCEADALPLASEQLSSEPRMLVFENAAPFMLARNVAAECRSLRFGRVAYGAGKQILKSVRYFGMLRPAISEVQYVGDLDWEGLRIGAQLANLSRDFPVRPATEFHRAMLNSAKSLGFSTGWPAKDERFVELSSKDYAHFASDLRSDIEQLLAAKRRIPEEAISRDTMLELLTTPTS